jgi:hypothetical protein
MMDKKAQGTPNLSSVFVGAPQTPTIPGSVAPSVGKTPSTPSVSQWTPPSDPSNQPSAPKSANDIMTMQQKLVHLSDALKDDARIKTILSLDDHDIEALTLFGSKTDPTKMDGLWGPNTNSSATQAATIGKQMATIAAEQNITLPFDANTVSGLGTVLNNKSAAMMSDFIDKMMVAIPELSNAVFPQAKTPTAGLSDADKFRLAQVSNVQVANIQLKHRSVPVMFSDIATPDAFQKFLIANKIRNGQLVLQYLNKVLKTKTPTEQSAPGVI